MEGGSCNAYDYTCGDPVNGLDLDGTKNVGFDRNDPDVARNYNDCTNGIDSEYGASAFCRGFVKAYNRGDLTDYGFGFVPDKPRKYLRCPAWLVQVSRFAGYGDFARAAVQAGGGSGSEALNTASQTVVVNDLEAQASRELIRTGRTVAGKIVAGAGVVGTAIDAACTNV